MGLKKQITGSIAAMLLLLSIGTGAPVANAFVGSSSTIPGEDYWVSSDNMPEKWKEAIEYGVTGAQEAEQCRQRWMDPSGIVPDMPRRCSVYEVTVLDYIQAWFKALPIIFSAYSSDDMSK